MTSGVGRSIARRTGFCMQNGRYYFGPPSSNILADVIGTRSNVLKNLKYYLANLNELNKVNELI